MKKTDAARIARELLREESWQPRLTQEEFEALRDYELEIYTLIGQEEPRNFISAIQGSETRQTGETNAADLSADFSVNRLRDPASPLP